MYLYCLLFYLFHVMLLFLYFFCFFFFKQKTAYEMRISDWSSDVCSSDLAAVAEAVRRTKVVPIQVDVTASNPEKDALLTATGGQALPFAVVVDRDDTVIDRFTGLFDTDSLVERPEEGRVGKEGVGTGGTRGARVN